MQPLILRAARRQLVHLTLVAGALAVVALAILLARYVAEVSWLDVLVRYGAAAAINAPLVGWAAVRYAGSFTECDAAGIRSRGPLGREWRCSWQFVADIAIRVSSANSRMRTVVVQTTGGDQIRLGMPVSGGVMPDPDFERPGAARQARRRRGG